VDRNRLRRDRQAARPPRTDHRGQSYGDALLAARSVGLAEPDTDWRKISDTVEPGAKNRGIYDELYRIYRDLYPATREASHALAGLQEGEDVVT
jgi:xylulokinase